MKFYEELGQEVFFQLVKTADLVIEQFRPGVLDKIGMGYYEAIKTNPKIIYVSLTGYGQKGPYAQQAGMNYSSDHVTSAGIGFGAGIACLAGKHFLAQTDLNIHWLNGNAVSNRLAVGYVRSGKWAPAVLGTVSVLWGSRTEVLLDDGREPVAPIAVVGIRIAPLRFQNERGYVSALETGYGFGPYDGRYLDVAIVAIGIRL